MEPLQDALGLLGESNLADPERARENITDHESILLALEAGDPERAQAAAVQHVRRAYSARMRRLFSVKDQ
jgi:DNA-binding GntR family transcriptional regulator